MTKYHDTRTNEERFISHVNKHGPKQEHIDTQCWNWLASKDAKGYGFFSLRTVKGFKVVRTHRFAYEQKYGPIPEGMQVCHHCDNPSCVRPSHLFSGTNQDNVRDKVSKNRQAKGTQHSKSLCRSIGKISDNDVLLIKRLFKYNTKTYIANRFGISITHVSRILNNEARIR